MEQQISVGQFKEEHICAETIMSIFTDLYYKSEIYNGDVIIDDQYKVITMIDQKNMLISFAIYFKHDDNVKGDIYEYLAEANDKIVFVKCCVDGDGDIYTEYSLCYTGGILAVNIINAFRKFVFTTRSIMEVIYEGLKND